MTDIQAAVGIEQLKKLDWIVEERRLVADEYLFQFKDIDCIVLPIDNKECKSNYQSFSIYLKGTCKISRDDLMQQLLDLGISTRRGIMTIHRESAFKNGRYELTKSEDLSDNSIIIPLFVPMKKEEIQFVVEKLNSLLR
jgi:dTDP-4-amino-4,6-dideoxygalactose transaminase